MACLASVCVSIFLVLRGPPQMTELGYLSCQKVQHAGTASCLLTVGGQSQQQGVYLIKPLHAVVSPSIKLSQ